MLVYQRVNGRGKSPEHQPLSRYEVGSVMKAISGKSIPGAVVRYEVPGVAGEEESCGTKVNMYIHMYIYIYTYVCTDEK